MAQKKLICGKKSSYNLIQAMFTNSQEQSQVTKDHCLHQLVMLDLQILLIFYLLIKKNIQTNKQNNFLLQALLNSTANTLITISNTSSVNNTCNLISLKACFQEKHEAGGKGLRRLSMLFGNKSSSKVS